MFRGSGLGLPPAAGAVLHQGMKKEATGAPLFYSWFIDRSRRSRSIRELMYLPLLGCICSHSKLSLSSLNDTIFCVITPRVFPPFLISSFSMLFAFQFFAVVVHEHQGAVMLQSYDCERLVSRGWVNGEDIRPLVVLTPAIALYCVNHQPCRYQARFRAMLQCIAPKSFNSIYHDFFISGAGACAPCP